MIRLRNTVTGVVVSVSAGTATRLGPEWVPVKPPPKPRTRATKKKT